LGIYLFCNDDNVRKQLAKFHTVLIFVQRRKNADLQDSGLIYDHGDSVALFMPQTSVMTCSDLSLADYFIVTAWPELIAS
jgi:hypothetical protein